MYEHCVYTESLLDYLQSMLDDFVEYKDRYGSDDRVVHDKLIGMLACKDMVEAHIGCPVNLQRDGKVTTGF